MAAEHSYEGNTMQKMRVEMRETVKHQGETFEKDDVRTVPQETGKYFCANGWAFDLSGDTKSAERDPNRSIKLAVDSIKLNPAVGV